jgi:hypothetical protein
MSLHCIGLDQQTAKRPAAKSTDRAVIDALAHYASLNDLSSDVFYRLGHRNDSVPSSSSKTEIVIIGTL